MPIHAPIEPLPADHIDALSGLSLMSQGVQSDGQVVQVKGQRSNIFQSECKIQEKVCKLVIDGGSFTNVISSDLVVALSLYMRRLPLPHYIQWINQSGTLKITHKARVKFSIGDYIDTVDCDVAPLSACHLFLGRPWQYDLNATHSGRLNSYSFVHKGVHHVLRPMLENAIKAEVFAHIKKKCNATMQQKLKPVLPQGGEHDMAISVSMKDASRTERLKLRTCLLQGEKNDVVVSENKNSTTIFETTDSLSQSISICCASTADELKKDKLNYAAARSLKSCAGDDHYMNETPQIVSKPRTALFQGRENDEPVAHQFGSARNTQNTCHNSVNEAGHLFKNSIIQFGILLNSGNERITRKHNFSHDNLYPWCKKIFVGVNLKEKKKQQEGSSPYILVGSMQVLI